LVAGLEKARSVSIDVVELEVDRQAEQNNRHVPMNGVAIHGYGHSRVCARHGTWLAG